MGKKLGPFGRIHRRIKNRVQTWLGLWSLWTAVDRLQTQAVQSARLQDRLASELREAKSTNASIHFDHHPHGGSWVFVVGQFRGRDYVECFAIDAKGFEEVVELLRARFPRGRIGRVDTPIPHFKGWLKREVR